jgi:hypothetical protein
MCRFDFSGKSSEGVFDPQMSDQQVRLSGCYVCTVLPPPSSRAFLTVRTYAVMQQPLPAATAAQNALKDVHARESNLNQLRMHQDECMLQAQKKKTDEKKDTLRSSPQKAATPRRSPRKAAAALSSPPRSPAPSSVPHESTVVGEPLVSSAEPAQ